MYLVESSTADRVDRFCEYQVFRQLFMAPGKSETGHVSECNRGCLAATRTFRQPARVGSGGGGPIQLEAGSRQSKAVAAFQSSPCCTGAATAVKRTPDRN